MAKAKTSSGERTAKIAKAGKRSGGYVAPPSPSLDNRAAREAGEQQFIAKQQQYVTKEVKVYNNSWIPKVKKIQVPVDFTYDENRKRSVMSPKFAERPDA